MATTIQTFISSDGTRRVNIFQREDMSFGFEELEFSREEDSWYPAGRYSVAIIDSLENAINEARGRVRWLADPDN